MFSHFIRKVVRVGPATGPAVPRRVRGGGRVWQVLPEGTAAFGPNGPDLAAWMADGRASVVKDGRQRTVYRVRLPGGVVFVKRMRINTPRAWAREILRPPKAKLEFENALALRARGVPAVEPLAWGARHAYFPGESLIITRGRPAAEPLEPHLASRLTPTARRRLSVALGELFAVMHDAGVYHPDPHPGNFLIDPGTPPRLSLIDVHDVGFGRPLSRRDSLANLVLFNRWFQLRATRADRLRFWLAYTRCRTTASDLARSDAAALETATAASNARFWADRLTRYRTANRQYRPAGRGPVRGFAVRDLPDAVIADFVADPDAPFRDGFLLKDSPSSTVAALAIPTPAGPRAVVYKRFRVKSPLTPWKNLLRPSAAMRSWLFGQSLLDRGFPTARPLLVLHRYRRGLPAEGYLLTEFVPAAAELKPAGGDFRRTRDVADRLGRLVRTMHERNVAHRDLKAPNVLLAGGTDPVLIDLVGIETGPVSRQDRVNNLTRLAASFLHSPHISNADRLRFLRAYLAWGLRGRGGWKGWWADIAAAARAKAARNARIGRVLG